MKHTFTEEDIIKFLYNEMSIRESEVFLDALYSDDELWDKFESYQHIVDSLIRIDEEPSDEVCDSIMRYVSDTQSHSKGVLQTTPVPQQQLKTMLMGLLILITSVIVTGSIYFVKTASQKAPQAALEEQQPSTHSHEQLEWEDVDTEQKLEQIKQSIDYIKEDNSHPTSEKSF